MNRFDLEQQLLASANIIEDIKLLVKRGAPIDDFTGLAAVYSHRFDEMWENFEATIFPAVEPKPQKHTPVPTVSTCKTGNADVVNTVVTDSDGNHINLSYGIYPDHGISTSWILGIDAPYETVSVALNDLTPLIAALQQLQKKQQTMDTPKMDFDLVAVLGNLGSHAALPADEIPTGRTVKNPRRGLRK